MERPGRWPDMRHSDNGRAAVRRVHGMPHLEDLGVLGISSRPTGVVIEWAQRCPVAVLGLVAGSG
jgi:hypothetical protein